MRRTCIIGWWNGTQDVHYRMVARLTLADCLDVCAERVLLDRHKAINKNIRHVYLDCGLLDVRAEGVKSGARRTGRTSTATVNVRTQEAALSDVGTFSPCGLCWMCAQKV